MEKFKEKQTVIIFGKMMILFLALTLISFTIASFTGYKMVMFIVTCIIFLLTFMFNVLHQIFSTKGKYTSAFILYIRTKLNDAKTLEELYQIKKEFEYLAVENGRYTLSYPINLKSIHKEILDKIDILEKQK